MKRLFGVMLAVAMVAMSAAAQQTSYKEPRVGHVRIVKMFEQALRSECQGIVESTTLNVVAYKERYPAVDFDRVLGALNRLGRETSDPTLSLKAHLASMYIRYGSDVQLTWPEDKLDHESVFRQIAEQMEKKFLASNDEK